MATTRSCLAQLSSLCLASSRPASANISARFLSTTSPLALRGAKANSKPVVAKKGSASSNPQKNKKKGDETKKKKKARTTFIQYDQRDADQFSLCDAMRYIRAFEVGQKPTSVKYEMHVKFKSLKNGPVIRNRLRLPHPVKTDIRICVICPPDSKYAKDALAAGASLVGEDEIFEAVKDGKIDFDRCICQLESLEKMNRAGLGRFLGPRGLMPSTKLGTVVKDPANMLKDLIGGAEYRERLGVVRMAIGQLGFTPEEMQRNIKAFVDAMKKDMANLNDKISKEFAEVVLSSTNSPGFPLNGEFRSLDSEITPRDLSTS
ncbi:hypothetical protein VTL71DRAFT_10005 [Oculimacula yallundae]|uniref:50S ribosomal protein L1 n=1 Tax=Oculimacula yallundae TaxID=86028 RepID=A0ABR4BQ68_9HELO